MKQLVAGIFATLTLAGLAFSPSGHAQDFPAKPVRVIVPFPPGGPLDVAGRLVGKEVSDRWGQPVLVENRPGSTTGPDALARSAPDGYTLMIISSTPLVSLPHMTKSSYDPIRSFVGIIQTATIGYALMAHPGTGLTSVQQLVEAARKAPGKLNFATGGVGSGQHLYVELFKLAAGGIDMTQVPYKGAGPALQALISGEVQLMLDVLSGAIPVANAGRARPLFVTGAKPVPQLPGVPTFDSLYPGLDISSWHGIFAPAGVPRGLQEKLAGDLRLALNAPSVSTRFRELGFEITGTSGDAFNEIVKRDYERWGEVIRKNNIRAD